MKKNSHIIKKAKGIIVIENVKKGILESYLFMNKMHITVFARLAKINKSIIVDMLNRIKNVFPTLKPEDMLENGTQRALILLRSGKNFVKSIIGDVLSVKGERNLRKTILNLFLWEARITSQTFNHFVGLVIAGNGRSSTKILT